MSGLDVKALRSSIAFIITLALVGMFCVMSVIMLVAAGSWVLSEGSGSKFASSVCLWAASYGLINLWSEMLRRGNR